MNFLAVDLWPLLATLLVAMGLCVLFLRFTRIIAKRVGLVDVPSPRKKHRGKIPLVGGLSIFMTYVSLHLAFDFSIAVIAASGLLLLVGITDDFLDLSPVIRLFFQAASAAILVIGGGYQIASVGSLFGSQEVVLTGAIAIAFSIVCVIGVVNAINMIDGADGLAGGIVIISSSALLFIVSAGAVNGPLTASLLTVLGATFVFVLFNTGFMGRRQKVFLGDSGSMFLGVILAANFIGLSQGDAAYMTPVVAGWVFGLPLMDSISVMVGRVLRGDSPLRAGRDHLHHRLLDGGASNAGCVLIMLAFHASLVAIGLLGNQFKLSMAVMFWGFVALTVAHHFITPRLIDEVNDRSSRKQRAASRRFS